ncbi:hypothetical protein Tco_1329647 [Tanacetum coccineum]
MLPGENINEYYVRFHKLVNDMRNIRMTMPNIQLNSKFVNNMSPEWDRFVTAVKLNKGLKETNHEQLYAYLKQHEKHAAQDRLIIERITPSTNDPLTFDKMLLMQAQENDVVLDEQELLFLAGEQGNAFDADVDNQLVYDLALNKDNIFQADECDAFDLDFDDEPTAQTISMANLSSARLCDQYSELPIDVPSSEEDQELAELTRQKMHEKLNDPVSSKMKGQRAKGQCPTPACPATYDCVSSQYIDPSGPSNASNYKSKVIPFFNLLKEHFDGVQKLLVTKIRAMKAVFEEMEAKVDQNAIDKKYREIEHKNLPITNENLIANCIAQDVFYTVTDLALSAS